MSETPREFKPLHPELFPEPARSFIRSASEALGVDTTFIAAPLLSALAGAIGNARVVQVKNGWTEPAVVWTAIVGQSGALKTPSINAVLKPLHTHQLADLARFQDEMKEYESAKQVFDLDLKAWKSAGNHRDEKPPDEPRKPTLRRTVASDATTEAVARLLRANPKGILLAVDELAGWLDGFNAYRSGKGPDVARWLEMWSAKTLIVDRVKDEGFPLVVENSAVSICGGIQPAVLARSMAGSNTENGLSARLLVAMPPTRPALWSDRGIDPDAESAMSESMDRLLSLRGITEEDGDRPRVVYLGDEARTIFRRWHDRHAEEQAEMDEAMAAVWSKLKGYAVRFALVLHTMEVCSSGARPGIDGDHIDAASMTGAIALADWFGEEALRVAEVLNQAEEERDMLNLVERIKSMGGETTVSSFQRSSSKYRTASEARAALKKLETAGHGRLSVRGPSGKGGRPSECFTLNGDGDKLRPEDDHYYYRNPTPDELEIMFGKDKNGLATCRPATIAEADSLLLDD